MDKSKQARCSKRGENDRTPQTTPQKSAKKFVVRRLDGTYQAVLPANMFPENFSLPPSSPIRSMEAVDPEASMDNNSAGKKT